MRSKKGTWCLYENIFCQEGFCDECMIYLEYNKKIAEKQKKL